MHCRTVTLISCGGEHEARLTVAEERPFCVLTVTLCTHAVILAFVNICETHTQSLLGCVSASLFCFFNPIVWHRWNKDGMAQCRMSNSHHVKGWAICSLQKKYWNKKQQNKTFVKPYSHRCLMDVLYDTFAGFAVGSQREAFVTRADVISLQISAVTMSAHTFIKTFIYICREKVTHTIHLREYTAVGHIYKGRFIRQKITELSTY